MDNGACSYRRFLDGDDEGVVAIIRDYKVGLSLFLNRYVHNVHIAEELAEETFFRILIKKPRFVKKGSFKTWLYTIGRNTAVNYMKRAKRTLYTNFEDRLNLEDIANFGDIECFSGEENALEQAYIREEEKIVVHRALARINPDYGRVLYLKFFEELKNDEIATILKKNKRQIENLIYQSKRALKLELDKEGFHYEGLQGNGR